MSKIGNTLKKAAIVLEKPYVTEKSVAAAEAKAPVYTFVVEEGANKTLVAQAVKAKYNVEPAKVNIVNLPGKTVYRRGKKGYKSGTRKALVYLKEGDKIEFA